ncbi:MAG: hypothetical protein HKN92_09425 [Chitinophagales bacterium]|nr:hypothetical protein [Chitinophagales bacterium]
MDKKDNTQPSGTKLDAIKEIIFGQNMREYEEEFEELRTHINSNMDAVSAEFSKMNSMIDTLEKKIDKNMDKMHVAMMEKMEKQHNELIARLEKIDDKKTDRAKLSKMLTDIANKLSS